MTEPSTKVPHSVSSDAHDLMGDRIFLRNVRLTDADGPYLEWMNDQEVVAFTESRFHRHSAEELRTYVENINADDHYVFRAIILRETGRHIGNIKLGPIDWHHRFGDLGIIIGAKESWGRGYATESIRLVANYAFSTLKLHKLTAGCYARNVSAIRAFQKAGFAQEGVRPGQYLSDGRYVDLVLLGLLNPADMEERDDLCPHT